MPSTIPYDPSLVLGNIVSKDRLDNLVAMAQAQAPADAAEDKLNTLISTKRSLDMTTSELFDLDITPTQAMTDSLANLKTTIATAAADFATKKIEAENKVEELKKKIALINESFESPVDYNRTDIKKMPLSADSLKMNAQYFAVDQNSQNSGTHASTIGSFVSDEVSYFGDDFASQASSSAQSQVNSQVSRHKIAGTMVISVVCTHKDAALLAPLILDVDKAIRVWNQMYPDATIKTDSIASMQQIAQQSNTKEEKSMTILSGATYGSCFIGMVHILNTTDTSSSEDMYSLAGKMQDQFKINGWFANASGGFGVDASFSNDVKNLLSAQNIDAHCSLVTLGSIPCLKSNEVAMGVKGFADDDGAKSMAALMKLQNATASDQDSVDASAAAARTGAQMITLQNSRIQASLSGLADIDNQRNKIIDTNSIMDALEDYVQKCLAGNIGVPINFYLKPITRSQLAEMWMAKYYPGQFLAISGDDSTPTPAPSPTPAPQPAPAPAA